MTEPNVSAVRALERLKSVYLGEERPDVFWKQNGGVVVGWWGEDVPEELLVAAGCLPVRIRGVRDSGNVGFPSADKYLERGFDVLVRARFERLAGGEYAYLDRIVLSNSSDALVRVFYYLRALRATEPEVRVPEPYFYDFMHSRSRMAALYNRARAVELKKAVESWTGKTVSADDLARAVAVCNENRRLLAKLTEWRTADPPRIGGATALCVIGAAAAMPKEEHSRLLRVVLEEAPSFPPLSGVRVFVTGSAHDGPDVYELIESCGAVVVGEDHETGNRYFEGLVAEDADPIDAIVDRYHLRSPESTRSTVSERVAALVEQVRRCRAQAVVAYIHAADDAPSWDAPEQAKALASAGVPMLVLDRRPPGLPDEDELRGRIAEFLASVRKRAENGG